MAKIGEGSDNGLRVLVEHGQGQARLLVAESGRYGVLALELARRFDSSQRTIVVEVQAAAPRRTWEKMVQTLRELLEEHRIRRASFVAFGSAGAVVQNFALADIRAVRSLVLVDGTARPQPTFRTRVIDWLEASLPLGLPFRQQRSGFDGKPFLQRIRCPVLVLTLPDAPLFIKRQREELLEGLPTAWSAVLSDGDVASDLSRLIGEFQYVRAKCPQKGKS